MPELPEVETTCRGISPHIINACVDKVEIRNYKLRWPVPKIIVTLLPGMIAKSVLRRSKYILIQFDVGWLIIHLGMSGSLRLVHKSVVHEKHDHIDIIFDTGIVLRYKDPRKFGSILWTTDDPSNHKLLKNLGPEPLSIDFSPDYLYARSRRKTQSIKTFIMSSRNVAGVGNIYANEALFNSGIMPGAEAGKLSLKRCEKLTNSIKYILKKAIKKGGTTLRDFVNSDGNPGYFQQELYVYGREGLPCKICNKPLRSNSINQRSSFYCTACQR
ncbi:MAG: bifunctional DNA-formamidopyrimidine glycosylase/DNA-(apurinic or apyrimidinic site) lyase [Gammaproteobacteria bacterium]|jgi:formamidopyrimidine-DNA glycosylase